MTVSIVQLTYNNRDQVRRCLPTVAALAASDEVLEWIVLDNASTDGTGDELDVIAADCPKLRVIRSAKNLGCCGGRNVIWRQAVGSVLLSMDSDVKVENCHVLPRMLADLKRPGVQVVGEHGGWIRRSWAWTTEAPRDYVGRVPLVAGFCQMFRRELVDTWEPFSLQWLYWLEDSDFCLQANAAGWIARYGMRHAWSRTSGRDDNIRRRAWAAFRKKWRGAGLDIHQPPGVRR